MRGGTAVLLSALSWLSKVWRRFAIIKPSVFPIFEPSSRPHPPSSVSQLLFCIGVAKSLPSHVHTLLPLPAYLAGIPPSHRSLPHILLLLTSIIPFPSPFFKAFHPEPHSYAKFYEEVLKLSFFPRPREDLWAEWCYRPLLENDIGDLRTWRGLWNS